MSMMRILPGRFRYCGVLRVLVVLGCLQGALFMFAARSVKARAEETTLSVAAQLMRIADATTQDNPRTLLLNGAELKLTTATTPHSISDVLDHFQGVCRQRGGLVETPSALARLTQPNPPPPSPGWLDGVQRFENTSIGVLGCVDTDGPLDLEQLLSRLKRFVTSRDLADLGQMRFVLARHDRGDTAVMAIWSEGPLPLSRMFPQKADAPGIDPASLPRPPGVRRTLSASERGYPYSLTAYTAPATEFARLCRFYRHELRKRGFALKTAEFKPQRVLSLVVQDAQTIDVIRIVNRDSGQLSVSVAALSAS